MACWRSASFRDSGIDMSVSRVNSVAQIKATKQVAGTLKLKFVQDTDVPGLAQIGSDLVIRECLLIEPLTLFWKPVLVQFIYFTPGVREYLDGVLLERLRTCSASKFCLTAFAPRHPPFLCSPLPPVVIQVVDQAAEPTCWWVSGGDHHISSGWFLALLHVHDSPWRGTSMD